MSGRQLVRHEPCPKCGSRDNLAVYSDGYAKCFGMGCDYYSYENDGRMESSDTSGAPANRAQQLDIKGEAKPLLSRNLTESTCQHWGYRTGEYSGKPAQFAYYYDPDTRQPIAAKVRFPDKKFTFIGDAKSAPLYGQWLWRDGGKMVVVTEGEIDALSVSQLQQHKWPVVSVQNGAQGAKRSLQRAYDWLCKFDTVVLMFDQDEPGIAAAQECAELFAPGKCKIAALPQGIKDANQALQENRGPAVIDAMWGAKTYRPDGIVSAIDLWDEIATDDTTESVEYPWSTLNVKTHGLRLGELVTITAGSGIGKSAVVREIAHHLLSLGETVGMIMLEESTKRTVLGMLGLHFNLPLHISRDGVTPEELQAALKSLLVNLYLYDHFGSTDVDNLLNRVRYLARSLGCQWVILDHLSIVVSGLDGGDDERKLIDRAMTMLRTLVQETGIGLVLVSHLKRPPGTGHEDGAQTSLSQLRGSAAIAQLSDMVIGLERNQQGDNPNQTVVRVLKNRFSGETGEAALLYYDPLTGRLTETEVIHEPVASSNGQSSPTDMEF